MATELVDLLEREGVELYDPRQGTERGWHNAPRFSFALYLDNDPGPVLPVHAAPVCTGQEVRPGSQKDFCGPGTLRRGVVVRDLDEESCHCGRSPSSGAHSERRLSAFRRLPEVDRLLDAFRAEGQHDRSAQSGRRVRSIQDLLHHASRLAVGDRRLLAPHTAREVPHLLTETIVPMLLEHGIRPAHTRRGLFDGVAEPRL